jgi:hypothetical protein
MNTEQITVKTDAMLGPYCEQGNVKTSDVSTCGGNSVTTVRYTHATMRNTPVGWQIALQLCQFPITGRGIAELCEVSCFFRYLSFMFLMNRGMM